MVRAVALPTAAGESWPLPDLLALSRCNVLAGFACRLLSVELERAKIVLLSVLLENNKHLFETLPLLLARRVLHLLDPRHVLLQALGSNTLLFEVALKEIDSLLYI